MGTLTQTAEMTRGFILIAVSVFLLEGIPAKDPCTLERNVAYHLNDATGGPGKTDTQLQCAQTCVDNPPCYYWTYRPSTGNCWHKDSKDGRVERTDRVSGNYACGVPGGCTLEPSTDYFSHDVPGRPGKTGTLFQCALTCLDNPRCLYWTHRTSTGECWHKDSTAGRVEKADRVSGNKECGHG